MYRGVIGRHSCAIAIPTSRTLHQPDGLMVRQPLRIRWSIWSVFPTRNSWVSGPLGSLSLILRLLSNYVSGPESTTRIRLVYVGILLEKRNLLPLAQAVVHANAQGMNIHFSLYGDGAFRPVLEKFASEHDCIEVLQPIQREEVPRVLGAVHVGVTSLPAVDDVKYAASSPIKLFEYLAAGMPILATANACHTDVVGDRRYAFWIDRVDNADMLRALTNIWQQRHTLQALGAEAAADAAGWTWDAAARKLDIALCLGLERLWSPLSPGCAATI